MSEYTKAMADSHGDGYCMPLPSWMLNCFDDERSSAERIRALVEEHMEEYGPGELTRQLESIVLRD